MHEFIKKIIFLFFLFSSFQSFSNDYWQLRVEYNINRVLPNELYTDSYIDTIDQLIIL